MKITTLTAAAIIGGLIGFNAPTAEAFPQVGNQLNIEQNANVTEVGFKKYKKKYKKLRHQRKYRNDVHRGHRSQFRDDRHDFNRGHDRHSFNHGHGHHDDFHHDRGHSKRKISKGGFTIYF